MVLIGLDTILTLILGEIYQITKKHDFLKFDPQSSL